ncbi:Mis12 protein-domain-containing protein [Calycina marina]|uniref:Mis12 protein-domain-containing protein n=1 Tax=Calycina marina TaxID=1763456 RepID=A0A9P7Z8M5_9HELO|nr:Mis12 protein-domain-containing protein [Calycina marina]
MSAPITSDTTLLTEHLTYRPAALIDDIINSINILAFRATDAVEKGLLRADPTNLGFQIPPPTTLEAEKAGRDIQENLKAEIENGVHQLETLLEAKIDKNFDKLEVYALRNILSVPPEVREWVRLGHYEGLNFMLDPDAPSSESISLQRRKLRETQKLQALLRAETSRNDATVTSLKALISNQGVKKEEGEHVKASEPPFAFLQETGDLRGDVKHPISTTASFALAQLPALKNLLQDLEPRLTELQSADNGAAVSEEQKSWRRERLEFVEKETKRHLESVRGLELGEMGEVRDGDWQGEGRTLGKGEVEDLERVVGLVGSGESVDERA